MQARPTNQPKHRNPPKTPFKFFASALGNFANTTPAMGLPPKIPNLELKQMVSQFKTPESAKEYFLTALAILTKFEPTTNCLWGFNLYFPAWKFIYPIYQDILPNIDFEIHDKSKKGLLRLVNYLLQSALTMIESAETIPKSTVKQLLTWAEKLLHFNVLIITPQQIYRVFDKPQHFSDQFELGYALMIDKLTYYKDKPLHIVYLPKPMPFWQQNLERISYSYRYLALISNSELTEKMKPIVKELTEMMTQLIINYQSLNPAIKKSADFKIQDFMATTKQIEFKAIKLWKDLAELVRSKAALEHKAPAKRP
jgi:hypothetical protein